MNPNRLLIIDDDPLICKTLEHIAQKSGFEAMSSDSAFSFFTQLELFEPSLIIVDLLMPNLSGVELMQRLAELNTTAKLIITSGQERSIIEAAASNAEQNGLTILGILEKPFSATNLRYLLTLHTSQLSKSSNFSDSPQISNSSQWTPTLEEIIQVVENDEITLDFQPLLRCSDGAVIGFEALARWDVPGRGKITPSLFVPLAEHNHLYSVMTRNIARKGIAWLGKLNKSRADRAALDSNGAPVHYSLAFNITMNALYNQHLPEQLNETCREHAVAPELVTLEVSEPDRIENFEQFMISLQQLSELGFRLSLDEIGTGHMAISELANSPFSEIKINQKLISQSEVSETIQAIIKSYIAIGKNLNLRIAAVGVETQQARDYLSLQGCDSFQGYLISKPLGSEQVEAWLRSYTPLLQSV